MCLMDGPASVQVTPTPKALRLALGLKIVMFFQLAVGICFILSQRYVDAGIATVAALVGLACFGFNASEEGFSIQSTLCYMSFAFVMLFWTLTRCVFFYLGKEASLMALASWQAITYQTAIISDIVVYFAASLISYLLYSELRRIIDDVANLARILTSPDALAAYAALPRNEEAADAADDALAAAHRADAAAAASHKPFSGDVYRIKA